MASLGHFHATLVVCKPPHDIRLPPAEKNRIVENGRLPINLTKQRLTVKLAPTGADVKFLLYTELSLYFFANDTPRTLPYELCHYVATTARQRDRTGMVSFYN